MATLYNLLKEHETSLQKETPDIGAFTTQLQNQEHVVVIDHQALDCIDQLAGDSSYHKLHLPVYTAVIREIALRAVQEQYRDNLRILLFGETQKAEELAGELKKEGTIDEYLGLFDPVIDSYEEALDQNEELAKEQQKNIRSFHALRNLHALVLLSILGSIKQSKVNLRTYGKFFPDR